MRTCDQGQSLYIICFWNLHKNKAKGNYRIIQLEIRLLYVFFYGFDFLYG